MSSYISAIQTQLLDAGFYKGKVDGIAGKLTVEAVERAIREDAVTSDEVVAVVQQNVSHPSLTEPAVVAPHKGKFVLGKRSLDNLKNVNADLVRVVKRAIEITEIDFTVIEGYRTKERQRELVRKGASRTMNSRHLTGHAVDIVPLVDGKISWNFNYYYPLAKAMAQAATELGVNIRWGGAWTNIRNKKGTPQQWVQEYYNGGGEFQDGPHFEIPR